MKKVTKAIKLVSGLTDEEKQELAEFFKVEEEAKEVEKEEVVVVEKEVIKKEEAKKDEPSQIDTLMEQIGVLAQEVKSLKEVNAKSTTFGAQKKQGEGTSQTDFDSMFKGLK